MESCHPPWLVFRGDGSVLMGHSHFTGDHGSTVQTDPRWKGNMQEKKITAPHRIPGFSPPWTWRGFHVGWNMNFFQNLRLENLLCFFFKLLCGRPEPGNSGANTSALRVIGLYRRLGCPAVWRHWFWKPLLFVNRVFWSTELHRGLP